MSISTPTFAPASTVEKITIRVKAPENSLPILDKYRKITLEHLSNSPLKPELVKSVERVIFEHVQSLNLGHLRNGDVGHMSIIRLYIESSRHIISNLSQNEIFTDNPNPYLYNELNEGRISVNELFKMTPQELYPDNWKSYANDFKQYAENLIKGMESNSNDHVCKKCKGNKTYTYMAQIRSCDEGMSLMIVCCTLGCNTKWCIK